MLLTLRNSAEKLQALLARLGRYGGHGGDALQPIAFEELIAKLAARYAGQHEIIVVHQVPCQVLADPEALDQALVHLVQNAIEANSEAMPVFLDLRIEEANAILEIVDSGCGMSPEFIRTRLFKPFHSSKPGGFGIGAFEARELIRAMGGRLDVESREELGTRFRVLLPLADAAGMIRSIQSHKTEVA
jgi:signal transduction histidine kinase